MAFFDNHQLADIGTHKLAYKIDGPKRETNQPIIIVFPGITSSINEFAAVARLLDSSLPILWYDRASYTFSEESPDEPSSTTIAKELDKLLEVAKIEPPYLIVGHSWGGTLCREFLALRPGDIRGALLIDTISSDEINGPVVNAILDGIDFIKVLHLDTTHKLTAEEWQAFMDEEENPKHAAQGKKEMAQGNASKSVLNAKNQLTREPPLLGDSPVVVIRCHSKDDFTTMYEWGVAKGNGTEQQREAFRNILEKWDDWEETGSRELFGLSRTSRYIRSNTGHNVQLQDPELVAAEFRWLFEHAN